jgi:hypothetical protein
MPARVRARFNRIKILITLIEMSSELQAKLLSSACVGHFFYCPTRYTSWKRFDMTGKFLI